MLLAALVALVGDSSGLALDRLAVRRDASSPASAPTLIVLFGAIASILLVAWILGRLNEVYI